MVERFLNLFDINCFKMEDIVRGNLFEEFETPVKADDNPKKENGISKEQTLKVYLRVRPHLGLSYIILCIHIYCESRIDKTRVMQFRSAFIDILHL